MQVDPAETTPLQGMGLQKVEYLHVVDQYNLWELVQCAEYFRSAVRGSAGQLAVLRTGGQDERVLEQLAERVAASKMIHPHGGVHQNHDEGQRLQSTMRTRPAPRNGFQRRITAAQCCQPPCALARFQSLQSRVQDRRFSRIPVSCRAFSSNASSTIKVVLICINMAIRCNLSAYDCPVIPRPPN